MCRQALGTTQLRCATDLFHHRLAFALAVEQEHRVFATRFGVGAEQSFEFEPSVAGGGIGISQRASWAYGGASTTTDAEVGIDHNLLARLVRADSLSRANVDASVAAHLLIATVRTEFLFVSEEAGFLELAHQLTHLEQGGCRGIREIALRQSVPVESALRAQVEHHVEFGSFFRRLPVKVDRTYRAACCYTVTV